MIMLLDKLRASDKLSVQMHKAPKVFCVSCREHIFYLIKESKTFSLNMLAPAIDNLKPPGDIYCPLCGEIFAGIKNDRFIIKTEKGYLP